MKPLKPNAIIDIIAPAGKISLPAPLQAIEAVIEKWGYKARFGKSLFGDHPFLANTTEHRFEDLKNALYATDSEAVWCYRGGSGCSELLPLLDKLSAPSFSKIFLGFSDITSLHIYLNQRWAWTTFHGPGAKQIIDNKLDKNTYESVKKLFHGHLLSLTEVKPINKFSENLSELSGIITGGNLSVIIHTLGTPYQINTKDKILLLEDTHEPAYKIRRMLTHLKQAGIFNTISALLLGEFVQHDTIQKQWIEQELQVFADSQNFPVFKTDAIGHAQKNYIIPLGENYEITL